MAEARELIENKKSGKRTPLKELGPHPDTGKDIVVLSGRYGPYVTDGDINATLPKGTEPTEVELDEAVELLAEKAAKKARKGKGRRKRKK